MSRPDPFGNLGQRDWGLSFWMALLIMAGAFVLLKTLGALLFFPLNVLLVWCANPVAAAAGETAYHYRTSMQTYGVQRLLLCTLGTLPPYLYLLLADGAVFSLIVGWPASACIAGFWLFLLDKMRGESRVF